MIKLTSRNLYKFSKATMSHCRTTVEEIRIQVPYGHLAGKLWNKDGKKTPIIALHGWLDNAGTWDHLCPLLSEDFPVFALDLPGFGLSSMPISQSGPYPTDGLFPIHKVTQHFNWDEIILLGHSMGGGLSMVYAGTFPDVVKKLVVIDIIKLMSCPPENQPQRTADSIMEKAKIDTWIDSEPPQYLYEDMLKKFVSNYRGSVTEDSAKTLLIRGTTKHENGMYSFSFSPSHKVKSPLSLTFEQQKEFAKRIKCDMLMVTASKAIQYEPVELYETILDIYRSVAKSFNFVRLEGTHHLHLNDPVPIAKLVNTYLLHNEVERQLALKPDQYFKKVKPSL